MKGFIKGLVSFLKNDTTGEDFLDRNGNRVEKHDYSTTIDTESDVPLEVISDNCSYITKLSIKGEFTDDEG